MMLLVFILENMELKFVSIVRVSNGDALEIPAR